jgi:hypothetical protein
LEVDIAIPLSMPLAIEAFTAFCQVNGSLYSEKLQIVFPNLDFLDILIKPNIKNIHDLMAKNITFFYALPPLSDFSCNIDHPYVGCRDEVLEKSFYPPILRGMSTKPYRLFRKEDDSGISGG